MGTRAGVPFNYRAALTYAIRYELAMVAPSLVDALLTGAARGLLIALPLYCLNVFTIVPALVVSTVAITRREGKT